MNNRINNTRFLKQEELAAQLLELDLKEIQYAQGGVPLLTMGDKVYVDATDSHTIIFGATGSKKTRMFAMPSLGIFARSGESFVVTDPKGELYQRTSGEVAQMGYEVRCLNLRDMEHGESWNPLALPYKLYHGGEKAKAMEMVNELAMMITDEKSCDEKFWFYTTVDILSGLIFYLFETEKEENCTLLEMNKVWNRYLKNRGSFLKEIKLEFGTGMIATKFAPLDNSSDKTVGSMEAIVSMAFNRIMVNEAMVEYLSWNEIDMKELAGKKSAIYLVIPDENTTYHFIASVFLEQFYEVMIKEAQENGNRALDIRMNFLIDEFANIPKITNMDSMITASRSRNIRFHLIIQSMKQLKNKYEELADVICSNCNNWVYLYSKEYELLQEISRLCGEVIYDNGLKVPLISEFDLQHLDKEKGEALVLSGRNFPCISNMKDIDDYPFAKGEKEPEAGPGKKREKEAENGEEIRVVTTKAEETKREVTNGETARGEIESGETASGESTEEAKTRLIMLLAVGPEGAVLEYRFCDEQVIPQVQFYITKDLRIRGGNIASKNVSWYVADKGVRRDVRRLEETSEDGFIYLKDLPVNALELYEEAKEPLCPVGKFRYEVMYWDYDREYIEEEAELLDYGGCFGEFFARKKMLGKLQRMKERKGYHSDWEVKTKKEGELCRYQMEPHTNVYFDATLKRIAA